MPTPKNSGFDPVEDAISEIAKGRMVIVTDDEDRENEGDLVMAASKVTPESINHMIAHARGLICVPLLSNQLKKLGISSMVPHNREAQRTDFTVSVDAAEGITTGISAFDRSSTIQILANPSGTPEELVQMCPSLPGSDARVTRTLRINPDVSKSPEADLPAKQRDKYRLVLPGECARPIGYAARVRQKERVR